MNTTPSPASSPRRSASSPRRSASSPRRSTSSPRRSASSPRRSTMITQSPASSRSASKRSSEEDVCAICTDPLVDPDDSTNSTLLKLPCGHVYHQTCMHEYATHVYDTNLKNGSEMMPCSCPLCRRRILSSTDTTVNNKCNVMKVVSNHTITSLYLPHIRLGLAHAAGNFDGNVHSLRTKRSLFDIITKKTFVMDNHKDNDAITNHMLMTNQYTVFAYIYDTRFRIDGGKFTFERNASGKWLGLAGTGGDWMGTHLARPAAWSGMLSSALTQISDAKERPATPRGCFGIFCRRKKSTISDTELWLGKVLIPWIDERERKARVALMGGAPRRIVKKAPPKPGAAPRRSPARPGPPPAQSRSRGSSRAAPRRAPAGRSRAASGAT